MSMTYQQWMREIDVILMGAVGMTTADLADWPSRDCFDAGCSPREAIETLADYQDDFPEDVLDALLAAADADSGEEE